MLNSETKRKIDSARNILVGKVPDPKAQVEQITTAMIYKFMDDMDQQNLEVDLKAQFFIGDYEKYSWTKLLDKKLSGQERLDLYVQSIANMPKNPHIPQLFRDIFKNAFLPFRDPRTLSLFLKEINEFSYNHSEDLGDAFEYLLSILGSQGDAGQFRTPRHIIDFIAEVVDPQKNESILDPACGTAGFLISAYKHIVRNHDGIDNKTGKSTNKETLLTPEEKTKLMNNIVGYDISPDMVKLSLVNMYLHGFQNPKAYEYDTLSSEKRWDETFDVIMANPPFMTPKGGIQPHKRFSIQANRAEVLFTDYIMEHLNINGRAGIIVPEGIIFKSDKAYKALRKKLVEDGLLAVVSLPAGVFQPYSGVKTSILFFDNQVAKRTDEILFIKVENDGFDLGAQRRPIDKNDLPKAWGILEAWKKGEKIEDENALWVGKEKIAESGDYNLTGERYREVEVYKNMKWEMVELGEVCEVKRGSTITKKQAIEGNIPVIAGGQNPAYFHNESNRNAPVITVSASGAYAGFVNFFNQEIYASDCSTIQSIDSKKIDIQFVYRFLKTKQQDIYNLQQGVGVPHVHPKDLQKIKIPLPPLSVQKEIAEQIEVKQNAINHAKEVIKSLERERRYFGQELRKLEDVEMVELGDKDLFQIESGGTPSSKIEEYWNGEINWATLVDLPQCNFITELSTTKRKITEIGLKKSSAKLLPKNTILVSSRATIGRIAIIKEQTATNQGFKNIIIKDEQKALPYFIAMCMTSKMDELKSLATGGTFGEISKSKILTIKIPLPPLEIQKQLVAEVEKEEEIITANKKLIEIMERKIEKVISEI